FSKERFRDLDLSIEGEWEVAKAINKWKILKIKMNKFWMSAMVNYVDNSGAKNMYTLEDKHKRIWFINFEIVFIYYFWVNQSDDVSYNQPLQTISFSVSLTHLRMKRYQQTHLFFKVYYNFLR
ncbi:hypothetical protein M8C21_002527, partial [Ambrosia artemisiifolia]